MPVPLFGFFSLILSLAALHLAAAQGCATTCGLAGQLCCSANEACATINNQATCLPSGAIPVSPNAGQWQTFTNTLIETEIETKIKTITSIYSSYYPTTTTQTVYATSLSCAFSLGETYCGSICCASGQYCVASGQCAVVTPIRPTSVTIVTITSTSTSSTSQIPGSLICPTGFHSCPFSLGGGCCTSGYSCGSTNCIAPSTATVTTTFPFQTPISTTTQSASAPIRPTSVSSTFTTTYTSGSLSSTATLGPGWQCPAGSVNCALINRPNSCCAVGEICQLIPDTGLGDVGCCPNGAICTGQIPSSCATGYINCPSTAGGGCCPPNYVCSDIGCILNSTAAVTVSTPTSSAAIITTGSTVPNAPFPFYIIPTTFNGAVQCSSYYSGCEAQFSSCTSQLGGGANGVTATGAAASVCSSLSSAACFGLQLSNCAAFGGATVTGTATTTVGSSESVASSASTGQTSTSTGTATSCGTLIHSGWNICVTQFGYHCLPSGDMFFNTFNEECSAVGVSCLCT